MDTDSFQRILTAFADTPADIDLNKGTLIVQVRDDLIEARLITRSGSLTVIENGDEFPAEQWIITRIARLPLLADRILAHIPEEKYFVSPGGKLLDRLEDAPLDEEVDVSDLEDSILDTLGERPAGVTSVLYLTSDAGEGKTTVISHLARKQAQLYKQKQQDWLLVPVPLGGRTFMRFDDVITGALVNRLRFPMLYFDAFVELVRMGVVVPAFDGFEEMFVEGTAGDAISALGNLAGTLQSSGTLLIAARKAYFEYKSLQAQTRLFDSLGNRSITFARLALSRWDYARFIEYTHKRGIPYGESIFREFAAKLQETHPLLTRAVLVKRLLDIAEDSSNRTELIKKIELDPDDYFRQFVGSIIEREAREKWIDKKGELAQPLISEAEHYELLAAVALEMWSNGTEALSSEVFDLVAEIFSDSKHKDKVICHQIIERLKQHPLIVPAETHRYSFDHEEFYHFFLGEAVGSMLVAAEIPAIKHVFRQGVLPRLSADIAARYAIRHNVSAVKLVEVVNALCVAEPRASFIRENLGGVVIRFVEYAGGQPVIVQQALMPPQALAGRRFSNVEFEKCFFQTTSLDHTSLIKCRFTECEFEDIELGSNMILDSTELLDCQFRSVTPQNDDGAVFVPNMIVDMLRQAGLHVRFSTVAPTEQVQATDQELRIIEKMLRAFMRSSGVYEAILQKRLGGQASQFFKDILPQLLDTGVLSFKGGGSQRQFRLGMPLGRLAEINEQCGGRFEEFLRLAKADRNR